MTHDEYNLCIDTWSDDLYRFACHCCNGTNGASDVVQEAYATLWEQHATVALDEARRFLFVVAQRRIADAYRSNQRHQALEPLLATDEQSDNSAATHFELRDLVSTALQQLSEQQRAILTLHDVEGYDYDEIAQMMQMSYTQVQVTTFRARIRLKKILTKIGYQ